jgi:HEAT repeat protein
MRKKMILVWVSGLLAAGVVLLFVPRVLDMIEEQRCLHRLRRGDRKEQRIIIQRLARMRSVRAIADFMIIVEGELEQVGGDPYGIAFKRFPWSKERLLTFDVVEAVKYIGKESLSKLRDSLESESPESRVAAALVIVSCGGSIATPMQWYELALRDPDDRVRRLMVGGLESRKLPNEDMGKILRAASKDVSPMVRIAVAEVIGALRPASQEWGDLLRSLVADENEDVRCEASRALKLTNIGTAGTR